MAMDPVFRFGTFTFHSRTCELFQEGRPVPLERQPAMALRCLLECAGETVTRHDLIEAIWSTDTCVSFDDGLNYCVRQLRIALGDDARAPTFIVTAPRRGYRFIADVEKTTAPTAEPDPSWATWWTPTAGLLLVGLIVMEAAPNNHHELAIRVARAVHDALF
jgi:DNA-binding winged helix-turn-helix (wHTH) protein